MPPPSERPSLSADLTEDEFLRWYWAKDELTAFARELGVRVTGSKRLLTARLAAALAGRRFDEPPPSGRASGPQLSGVLSSTTPVPAGQRCSQLVRGWMTAQVGPEFHFDAPMRAFFAAADGTTTLQDAVDHWHATRDRPQATIDAQFEFNRFTRSWHEQHPGRPREELLRAWREYRSLPVDGRGRA